MLLPAEIPAEPAVPLEAPCLADESSGICSSAPLPLLPASSLCPPALLVGAGGLSRKMLSPLLAQLGLPLLGEGPSGQFHTVTQGISEALVGRNQVLFISACSVLHRWTVVQKIIVE